MMYILPITLLTMLNPVNMPSLLIIAAIILNSCNPSTSFSTHPTCSQKHFFANRGQHPLSHSSTSLFSTAAAAAAAAAIHHLDDDNMQDILFSAPQDSPSAVLVDAYTQW